MRLINRTWLLGVCLAALMWPLVGAASHPLKFVSFPIPGMVVDEERGVFVQLAREVARRAGREFSLEIYPPKRALVSFTSGSADILFPATKDKFPADFAYYRTSEPIFTKRNFIFTRKSDPILFSYQQLDGVRVGVTRGFSYSKTMTPFANELEGVQLNLVSSNSDEINARMLMSGRIDAFLAEEVSGLRAFNKVGAAELVHYDSNSPVGVQEVFFAVKANAEGRLIAEKLSKALIEMKQDGAFDRIMSRQ